MTATAQRARLPVSGNPIIDGWYADPELHLFDGCFWLYPTCSKPFDEQTTFDAFSSPDLVIWTRHPRILDFADVPWSTNRAAWAPSCARRDGRYYFYFSAGDGAGLGVAIADSPAGPFADALGKPLVGQYPHGAQPIDAHCFIDDDGEAYLYFGGHRRAVVARLAADMTSFVGDFIDITPENYVEGPFMLKRGGRYYFMWSEGNWSTDTYCAAYAIADSPFGPFVRAGTILRNDPLIASAAGHHSVIALPDGDEHLIAYHRRPLGLSDENQRVVCLDRMLFNDDGSIAPVRMTNAGVGSRRIGSAGRGAGG